MIKKIKIKISRAMFWSASIIFNIIYPLNDSQVCFLSDVRETMGGNMACVYQWVKDKDYQCLIEFRGDRRDKRSLKQYIKLIKILSTSKYIILDDYCGITSFMRVRKEQELVQLWHGAGAYKKFGFSRLYTGENVGHIHPGYKKYTKTIVSSEEVRWCFAEAFSISEDKVKATGSPRTDIFFDEAYKKEVKERFYAKYPQFHNKKILLFAPTWRGVRIEDAYYDMNQLNLQDLYEHFGDEYVFILKWHPAVYNNIIRNNLEMLDLNRYGGFYQDFSSYRDINDLLIVSDMLITDYSSVIFDYVLLDKPIIYYVYDEETYVGCGGRGLYFEFNEYIYGKVARNCEELIAAIEKADMALDRRKYFINKFVEACDGHSTEKTCHWIFG